MTRSLELHDWRRPSGCDGRLGELNKLGTVTPLMIAVPTVRLRYRDADGIKIIVLVKTQGEVLFLMAIIQYGAAFSDRLDVCRLVFGISLNRHEFLFQVEHHHTPAACSDSLVVESVLRAGVLSASGFMAMKRICHSLR